MTREELMEIGIYVPEAFDEECKARFLVGQKILFAYTLRDGQIRPELAEISAQNGLLAHWLRYVCAEPQPVPNDMLLSSKKKSNVLQIRDYAFNVLNLCPISITKDTFLKIFKYD